MKYAALLLLLLGPIGARITWVRDRNAAEAAGRAAYARGQAGRAARSFAAALAANPRRAPDPQLVLNLAHAQLRAGHPDAARAAYGSLLAGSPANVSSVARQQLAVLAASRGNVAQAVSLLRQALLLDPRNATARFDYEVLSAYLAQRPAGPKIPPPGPAAQSPKPKPAPNNSADKNQPASRPGADHSGQVNAAEPAPSPTTPPQRRPAPTGPADPQRPADGPGATTGGATTGQGPRRPVPSGAAAGNTRGLDRTAAVGTAARNGTQGPGTDEATPADQRLQTHRERLRAMNLSPAQARQLLETLRAEEQQYLQQLTRPAARPPDPRKPTW